MTVNDVITFPGYVAVIAAIALVLAMWCALVVSVIQAIEERLAR